MNRKEDKVKVELGNTIKTVTIKEILEGDQYLCKWFGSDGGLKEGVFKKEDFYNVKKIFQNTLTMEKLRENQKLYDAFFNIHKAICNYHTFGEYNEDIMVMSSFISKYIEKSDCQ